MKNPAVARRILPEHSIVNQILEYLRLRGYICKRNNAGFLFVDGKKGKRGIKIGDAGWPDIEGVMKDGRYFGIEVKAKRGILSPNQKIVGQKILDSKGIWFVARSLDDVMLRGF